MRGGLEHLKIETRLRGGRFESVNGECVIYDFFIMNRSIREGEGKGFTISMIPFTVISESDS